MQYRNAAFRKKYFGFRFGSVVLHGSTFLLASGYNAGNREIGFAEESS